MFTERQKQKEPGKGTEKIKVALLDDHRTSNGGMKAYLGQFDDLQVVGMACSGQELLAKIADWQPQVLLLDLRLDNPLNGVGVIRALVKRPNCPEIVVVSACRQQDSLVIEAMRAGACSYVSKGAEPEEIVEAIRASLQKTSRLPRELLQRLVTNSKEMEDEAGGLSYKEREILSGVIRGETNQEIANHLGLAEDTVKKYVAGLCAKLDATGRHQLTIQALRKGLVEIDEYL